MPANSANPEPDRLRTFCTGVVSRHRDQWPPEEHAIAQEFISFMGSMFTSDLTGVRRCCAELGISVSTTRLPHELRGYNSVFEDKRTIVISEYQSWPGADAHTLLHELREVMEYSFRELGRPIASGQELEKRAERFAILVRTASVQESLPQLIESANHVSSKWLRWSAYLAIGTGAFLFMAAFALVPYFEDRQELEEKNAVYSENRDDA